MPSTNPQVAATPVALNRRSGISIGQTYGALIALCALIIFNAIFTKQFLTLQTLSVILSQVSTVVIVAIGMTLVIATGGIDLSVGSLMAISGALAPLIFLNSSAPSNEFLRNAMAIIASMLACAALGFFNGTLVTRFRIQPIVATLTLFIAGRGLAQVITGGNLQNFENPAVEFLGRGKILGIPVQAILMLVQVAVVAWVVRATVFGRYILAVGGNEKAANLAGIPTRAVKQAVYALSGLFAGLAGLIVIGLNKSSDANVIGLNMELDAIAAVAVGGTRLTGGQASVAGTLVGAMLIRLIRTTLVSHNVPEAAAMIVNAAIILAAVYIQRPRRT